MKRHVLGTDFQVKIEMKFSLANRMGPHFNAQERDVSNNCLVEETSEKICEIISLLIESSGFGALEEVALDDDEMSPELEKTGEAPRE